MLRSLFSGVTGLSANIVELDVVGNNIANVNTVGFKSARVTFQEILTQNIRPATRPAPDGGLGGTNPQQIGLGAVVGSIDSEFQQGNLRTTGNKTDLAIQGLGFFVLSDGQTQSYSRAGNFTFDSENYLVSAATGMKVQGVLADQNGEFVTGAIGDIQIDASTVVPARATQEVTIFGNLSSESDAQGTHLLQNGPLLAVATGADDLRYLYSGADGDDLRLTTGDVIALTGMINGTSITDAQFTIGPDDDGVTLEDLRAWFETALAAQGAGGVSVNILADGSLEVVNAGGDLLENVQLAIGGRTEFNQVMLFGDTINPGESRTSASGLLSPADVADTLSDIYNDSADLLNFQFADDGTGRMVTSVEIGGTLGTEAITPTVIEIEEDVTTLGELLDRMTQAFAISNEQAITITAEGRIDVQGDVGLNNAIGNISLQEPGNLFSNLASSIGFGVVSSAKDADTYSVTSMVYDSLGNTHNLTLDFTKRTGLNIWDWRASLDGDEEITAGESGVVTFDERGSLISFLYTDGGGQISFRPQASGDIGAEIVTLSIDAGTIGGVNGLTQFEPVDQIQSYADGYTVGRLVDFDIDNRGVVTGRFSNDTVRDLARVALARFNNPEGLLREGANTYVLSGNSGTPIVGFASEGGMGSLSSGALEASNVDLAEQFTRMVVAQRAFQSNSRVISTSDEVLQELVNIV